MTINMDFTRHGSITRLAALGLLACCLLHLPGRIADAGTITVPPVTANAEDVVILSSSVLSGLGRGQSMRFTLFNTGSTLVPLRAQVKLFDAQGRVVAVSDEVVVPTGEFRSFSFNRGDIPLAGEDGTGRLQLRGAITLFDRDINDAVRDQIPTAVEVMDNITGATVHTCHLSPYVPMLVIARI